MTPLSHPEPYETLAGDGWRFNFVFRGETADRLPATVAGLENFAHRFPGSIVSIEGLNEIKIWPAKYHGLEGFAAGVALQRDLYQAVKASPVLANIPVLAPTLGGASAADQERLGDLSDIADFGNAHVYFDGRVPSASWRFAIDLARRSTPRLPESIVTETGYSSAADTRQGVPEEVQARYLLVLLAEAWRERIPAVYLYQLVDDRRVPGNWSRYLGLYDIDWKPKLAAHAIHHLSSALAARAAPHATPSEHAQLAAADQDLHLLELARADGSHCLLIWREVKLWDDQARHLLSVAPREVSLQTRAHARRLDLISGATTTLTPANGTLHFPLTDAPVLIELMR
jgi:hypothetical protein